MPFLEESKLSGVTKDNRNNLLDTDLIKIKL